MFFAVIEFTENNTIATVSTRWLSNENKVCKWPTSNRTAPKLAKLHSIPTVNWQSLECKVLQSNFESYDAAFLFETNIVESSDVASASEATIPLTIRSRIPSKRAADPDSYYLSDESEEYINSNKRPKTFVDLSVPFGSIPAQIERPAVSLPTTSHPIANSNNPNQALQFQTQRHGDSLPLTVNESFNSNLEWTPIQNTPLSSAQPHIRTAASNEMEIQGSLNPMKDNTVLKRLCTTVTELCHKVDFLSTRLDHLSSALITSNPIQSTSSAPPINIKALSTIEELDAFESTVDFAAMVAALHHTPGINDVAMTRNCLIAMISNGLAKQLNWAGKGEKRGIQHCILVKVVKGAVLQRFPHSDINIVEKTIKDWMRYAGDRCGGRRNRHK